MKKPALALKGGARRGTIGEFKARVSPDVDVKLIVEVEIGPADEVDGEVGSIGGEIEREHSGTAIAYFFVNDSVG